jgi:hypothetical protein
VQSISLVRQSVDAVSNRTAGASLASSPLYSEGLEVNLELVSRDPDGMPRVIRAFYGSPSFDDPRPFSEDEPGPEGKRLHVSVTYRDAVRAQQ